MQKLQKSQKFQKSQRSETVNNFRQAYWQLFCARDMSKITVSDLCKRAGYNRGTFYLHFNDIDDVRLAIEADVMNSMLECVESCLKNVMRGKLFLPRAMNEVLQLLKKDEEYIVPLLGDERDPEFIEHLTAELKPLWRTYVIGNNTKRSEAEIDLILEQAITGGLKMIGEWLKNPRDVSPAKMAKLVYDLLIRDVSVRVQA